MEHNIENIVHFCIAKVRLGDDSIWFESYQIALQREAQLCNLYAVSFK